MGLRKKVDVAVLMAQSLPTLPAGLTDAEEDELLAEILNFELANPKPGELISWEDLPE